MQYLGWRKILPVTCCVLLRVWRKCAGGRWHVPYNLQVHIWGFPSGGGLIFAQGVYRSCPSCGAVNSHPGDCLPAGGLVDLHAFYPVARLAVALRVALADGVHHVQPLADLAEDGVPVVQPRRRHVGYEELRAAGVRAGVRHREDAGFVVPETGVELVRDTVPRTAGPRARRVAPLRHEALYDAVEGGPVEVAVPRQRHEVIDGLRRFFGEEPDPDRTLLGGEVGVVLDRGIECHLRWVVVRLVRHSCLLGSPSRTSMLTHPPAGERPGSAEAAVCASSGIYPKARRPAEDDCTAASPGCGRVCERDRYPLSRLLTFALPASGALPPPMFSVTRVSPVTSGLRTLNLDHIVTWHRGHRGSSVTTVKFKVVDGAHVSPSCEPVPGAVSEGGLRAAYFGAGAFGSHRPQV